MTQEAPWISLQPIGDRPSLAVRWWGIDAHYVLPPEVAPDAAGAEVPDAPNDVPSR